VSGCLYDTCCRCVRAGFIWRWETGVGEGHSGCWGRFLLEGLDEPNLLCIRLAKVW